MDKLRVYQISTIGLLLLNVVLMAFIFFAPRPGGEPLRAVERLGLDEAQAEQFHTLAREHQLQIKTVSSQQSELLQTYFLQLTTDTADKPGPLPTGVATLEAKKINGTYQHLLDIKKILRPEQQAAFPDFVNDALKRILLKKDRKGPPRKGR